MPDDVNLSNPLPSVSGNAAPTGTPPGSGGNGQTPPPASAPEQWRAGPNAPAWARGKSADELLALSVQMAAALQAPPAAAPVAAPALPTDDDFINRPSESATRIADARMASALNPVQAALESFAATQAQTVRSLAAERHKAEFGRWGAEIDTLMQTVRPEQRTLDNYEKVVTFVRGQHTDELVEARARELMAAGGLTERSGGGAGLPTGTPGAILDLSKLPGGMAEAAQRAGLTTQQVMDFCRATNTTPQKWMEDMQNMKVFTQTAPFTFEMKGEALGLTRQFSE